MTKALPYSIIDTESEGDEMKDKIYEIIKRSGKNGIRLRDIGFCAGVWHCSCLGPVCELMEEGKVISKTIGHGWEAYIKYYAT